MEIIYIASTCVPKQNKMREYIHHSRSLALYKNNTFVLALRVDYILRVNQVSAGSKAMPTESTSTPSEKNHGLDRALPRLVPASNSEQVVFHTIWRSILADYSENCRCQ